VIRRSNPYFLSALAATLVVAGLGVGSMFLRSSLVQKSVARNLSKISGMEVRFESFQPGIFTRSKMSNLTATNSQGDSLSAREAKARISWLPLLSGHLVFREIAVTGVRLVRVEHTPATAGQPQPASPAPATSGSERPRQTTPADPQPLDPHKARLLKGLRLLKVSDTSVDWQLSDGRTKLQLEGVDLLIDMEASGEGSGELRVGAGTWMELIRFTGLKAALKISENGLTITELDSNCGTGKITGTGTARLAAPQAFQLQLNAAGIDLAAMTAELPSLRLTGGANGSLQLAGNLTDDASWSGKTELGVKEGSFKGLTILQMLGQLFQVQELANLKVKEAKLHASIGGRKIMFDEFLLHGGDIVLSAPGALDFDRKLDLHATLKLHERLLGGRALQLIGPSFSAPDPEGLRSIAFQVAGSLEKPSTNLMEKVMGEGLGGMINQVLGGFLKPRKNEAKEQSPPK